MNYKKLVIKGISYSQTQTGSYALILEHSETLVKLPIIIGDYEARLISLGLEKDLSPPRPTTHDLFAGFMKTLRYRLHHVVIQKIVDGVFFSNLFIVHQDSGEELIIDARTSDAVTMAIKFDAPIYTIDQVLHEAGVFMELHDDKELDNEFGDEEKNNLKEFSPNELQSLLDEAVQKEDFEKALKMHEEIKRRKTNDSK